MGSGPGSVSGPVFFGQTCPTCGRCPTCGLPQYQLSIPGYSVKFDRADSVGLVVNVQEPNANRQEAHRNPFAESEPTHDGHGDDGGLLAGP